MNRTDWIFASAAGAILLAGAVVIALVIVEAVNAPDRGKCLNHHLIPMTTVILVGKVVVPHVNLISVCDTWEFPEGRPPA
jgi:hypothetical protein